MDKRSTITTVAAISAALFATALIARGEAQQSEAEVANTSSSPLSCLPHPTINRTKILNGKNIVFVTRDHTIYNNQLPKQCASLNRRSLVNYAIANGRICAGDRFQVLWEERPGSYLPAAQCQLGYFVAISEAELEDLMAMTAEKRERRGRGRSTREAVTSEQVELPRADTTVPVTEATAPPDNPDR
jgi:hypothetical protein